MTARAPSERARLSRGLRISIPTVRAPSDSAIMIAESPTPPQPKTATQSPGPVRPWVATARKAVVNRQPRLAAVTSSMTCGRRTRLMSA